MNSVLPNLGTLLYHTNEKHIVRKEIERYEILKDKINFINRWFQYASW